MYRRSLRALIGIVVTVGCSRAEPPAPGPVAVIFAALRDSITRGGEASRIVPPPRRSYQQAPDTAALGALAALLALPVPRGAVPALSCRWAPVDSAALGMDITVTEFEVVADSAMVSVMRECVQRQRGRTVAYHLEPTWYLKRRSGLWVVTRTRMRVTQRPAVIAGAVG